MSLLKRGFTFTTIYTVPLTIRSLLIYTVGGGAGGFEPFNDRFSGGSGSPGGTTSYRDGIGQLIAGFGGSSSIGGTGTPNFFRGRFGQTATSDFNPRADPGYLDFSIGFSDGNGWRYGSGGPGATLGTSGSSPSSSGGGGGGAGYRTMARNTRGAVPGENNTIIIGFGGSQGGSGNRRAGARGIAYIYETIYDPATINYFRGVDGDVTMINNGIDGITLEWGISYNCPPGGTCTFSGGSNVDAVSTDIRITTDGNAETLVTGGSGVNKLSEIGTFFVRPVGTRTYRIIASNPGTRVFREVTVTVYQPPTITITLSPEEIINGNSSTLQWEVGGDVDTVTIDQGIGDANVNGSTSVSPSETTTYTITASGLGGTLTKSITLTVYQTPELTVTFPGTYDYGVNQTMTVTTRYASVAVRVDLTYNYQGGSSSTDSYILTPNGSSESGDEITETFTPLIEWNTLGPETIDFLVTATGLGGEQTRTTTEDVIIDRLPDSVNIPDTSEVFPQEDPVVSPNDDTILSDPLSVTGIDIPVEIKSNRPIQVRFDDNDPEIESNWQSLRQI